MSCFSTLPSTQYCTLVFCILQSLIYRFLLKSEYRMSTSHVLPCIDIAFLHLSVVCFSLLICTRNHLFFCFLFVAKSKTSDANILWLAVTSSLCVDIGKGKKTVKGIDWYVNSNIQRVKHFIDKKVHEEEFFQKFSIFYC